MENNNEVTPKKSNGGIIAIVIALVLFFVIAIVIGFVFVLFVIFGIRESKIEKTKEAEQTIQESKKKKEEKKEDTVVVDKEEFVTDAAVKEKLERIVSSVSYANFTYQLFDDFYGGKEGITDSEKIKLVFYNLEGERVFAIPDKYKDNEEFQKIMGDNHYAVVLKMPLDMFNKKMRELFVTSVKIDKDTLNEALKYGPQILEFDSQEKVFYYYFAGGGLVSAPPKVEITKYTKLKNQYYVYVNVTRYDSDTPQTSTVVWTFDNNYRFIRTTVK